MQTIVLHIILLEVSLVQWIKGITPRQFAFLIGLVYTVTVAAVLVPGILPDGTANTVSRIQNAVTVAYVAYVARYPFTPERALDAKTRVTDTSDTSTGA